MTVEHVAVALLWSLSKFIRLDVSSGDQVVTGITLPTSRPVGRTWIRTASTSRSDDQGHSRSSQEGVCLQMCGRRYEAKASLGQADRAGPLTRRAGPAGESSVSRRLLTTACTFTRA